MLVSSILGIALIIGVSTYVFFIFGSMLLSLILLVVDRNTIINVSLRSFRKVSSPAVNLIKPFWLLVNIIFPIVTVLIVVVLHFELYDFLKEFSELNETAAAYLTITFASIFLAYLGRPVFKSMLFVLKVVFKKEKYKEVCDKALNSASQDSFRGIIYLVLLIITGIFAILSLFDFVIVVDEEWINLSKVDPVVDILSAIKEALLTFVVVDTYLQIKFKKRKKKHKKSTC